MKAAKLCVFAWSMLAGSQMAIAKVQAAVPAAPTPVNSPGAWVGSGDYPATALRHNMAGIAAFRLSVDATGTPSRCEIVESSGFDILDKATCDRVMANARFTPAHDQAGRPIEGTYRGRIRWVVPAGDERPVSEHFGSVLLAIDQTGKVTSCRIVLHVSPVASASPENSCGQMFQTPPSAVTMEFRGGFQGALAEVEIQIADTFTPALRERVLAPMAGYEQRALNVQRFTVTRDGKLGQCIYEQQRGSALALDDFCEKAQRHTYDPPFAAFDKDGIATGWHIARVMLKTSE